MPIPVSLLPCEVFRGVLRARAALQSLWRALALLLCASRLAPPRSPFPLPKRARLEDPAAASHKLS
eukprot:scaffold232304_cov36-Tisochrysis_lutea.AAC.1